jgi:hypothetical protein
MKQAAAGFLVLAVSLGAQTTIPTLGPVQRCVPGSTRSIPATPPTARHVLVFRKMLMSFESTVIRAPVTTPAT